MNQDLSIYSLYSQLKGGVSISDAIRAFRNLEINNPSDGDTYFEAFGVGHFENAILQPWERFACYEFLLSELKKVNNGEKYEKIHKGTPYYFLSWTSFDIGNFEKANFYLDAAFEQDIRKSRQTGSLDPIESAFSNPGGGLLRLDPDSSGPIKRTTVVVKSYVESRLSSFKSTNNLSIILDEFVEKFVKAIIKENPINRTIVTTLYTFIFEFEDHYKLLNLRSDRTGSIEPFLVHLFKGGLVFETLLKLAADKNGFKLNQELKNEKLVYIKNVSKHRELTTIGKFNLCKEFKEKYCELHQYENLSDLVNLRLGKLKDAFNVTYNLRNKTGHDLRQGKFFENPNDYKMLFEQEMAAILYIINKEFIEV